MIKSPGIGFYTPKGLILSHIWAWRFRPASARYRANFSQTNNNNGKLQMFGRKNMVRCAKFRKNYPNNLQSWGPHVNFDDVLQVHGANMSAEKVTGAWLWWVITLSFTVRRCLIRFTYVPVSTPMSIFNETVRAVETLKGVRKLWESFQEIVSFSLSSCQNQVSSRTC